jgi:hypothetical protein
VDHAFRLGATTSVSVVFDSSTYVENGTTEAKMGFLPSMDLEASLGIRDTSAGDPGFGLRISGRVGLGGYGGAAYAELPRAWIGNVDAGIGIQLQRSRLDMVIPYIQIGMMRRTESSWFLRNGIVQVAVSDSTDRTLLWMPTVGWYRHRRSGFEGGWYVTAVIGDQPVVKRECILFGCLAAESYGGVRTFLMFGATISKPLAGDPPRRFTRR